MFVSDIRRFGQAQDLPLQFKSICFFDELRRVACIEKSVFVDNLRGQLFAFQMFFERVESNRTETRIAFDGRVHLARDDSLKC